LGPTLYIVPQQAPPVRHGGKRGHGVPDVSGEQAQCVRFNTKSGKKRLAVHPARGEGNKAQRILAEMHSLETKTL